MQNLSSAMTVKELEDWFASYRMIADAAKSVYMERDTAANAICGLVLKRASEHASACGFVDWDDLESYTDGFEEVFRTLDIASASGEFACRFFELLLGGVHDGGADNA